MPKHVDITGSIPAVITPFAKEEVDYKAAAQFALRTADHAQALVVAGSTEEGASLTDGERIRLIEVSKTAVGTSKAVIAGVSAAATHAVVRAAVAAEMAGADALLLSTPFYTLPTEDGIVLHFKTVAEATTLPVILYNIPSRTGCNLCASAIVRLRRDGVISGLKESAKIANRVKAIADSTDPSFAIYCGDDVASLEMLSAGARGTISVVANLLPGLIASAHKHFAAGETAEAAEEFALMQPLAEQLGKVPNPTGVKHAMNLLGLCPEACRLPLTEVGDASARAISKCLKLFQTANLQQAIDGAHQRKPLTYL